MPSTPNWRRYLRFWGPDLAGDVDEEFRFHLEVEVEELIARGLSPEAARAEAMRRFGDVAHFARDCRSTDARRTARVRRSDFVDVLRQDIRYTLRSLFRQRGFAAIAVLTLGLGIGATTAIFSVVNGVLLSPLPYHEPKQLVLIWETLKDLPEILVSYPNYRDWQERARVFDGLAIYNGTDAFNMTGDGDPERVRGGLASGNLFSVLGVRAERGRLFGATDDRTGADRVVVLSDGFWRRRFGADERVLGKPLTLDGNSYTIIGVLPASVQLADRDLWVPIGLFTSSPRFVRPSHPGLLVIGRLKAGVTIVQMQQDLDRVTRTLREEYPAENAGVGASGAPLLEMATRGIKPALVLLAAAVGLVLLVACANVANLLLGRAAARQREFALRVAIGAARGRLVRQLLTESVVLAAVGGTLGLALAWAGLQLLITLRPTTVPRLTAIHVDGAVLAFALTVSVLTGLAFGLAPALQSARSDPLAALREGGRSATSGRTRLRARAGLTVAEVSLALMLLVGAGLLLRSFAKLTSVDPGIDPRDVVAAFIQLPPSTYPDEARQRAAFDELLARMRARPDVQTAAISTDVPISSSWQLGVTFEGFAAVAPGSRPLLNGVAVSTDYFRALGMRQLAGRPFAATDIPGQPPVVVVSEAVSKRFYGGANPVGRRMKHGGAESTEPWLTIVGVVGEVRNDGPTEVVPRGTVYFPITQTPVDAAWILVRSEATVDHVTAMLRREVAAVDRDLPIANVRTLEEMIDRSVAQPKFSMLIVSVFAAVALVLAAVGLYGVISFSVAQRSREIGVRIALGAQRRAVLGMVVRQAMALTAAGIVVGGVGALAGGRLMAKLLFGVTPTDPWVFALAVPLVATVALTAAALPAWRASRIDPTAAIRGD